MLRSLLVLIFCFVSYVSYAADAPFYSHHKKGALKGADVVAYYSLKEGDKAVLGRDEFTYEWRGATWKFSSEENRRLFSENPEKYIPEFGGYCAYAMWLGFTNSILPNSWTIIDDKLYLNHNRFTKKRFLKKPEEFIEKAKANWPQALTECEASNKCQYE